MCFFLAVAGHGPAAAAPVEIPGKSLHLISDQMVTYRVREIESLSMEQFYGGTEGETCAMEHAPPPGRLAALISVTGLVVKGRQKPVLRVLLRASSMTGAIPAYGTSECDSGAQGAFRRPGQLISRLAVSRPHGPT